MSHRASERTEANYPAPQHNLIDPFWQQEDIRHLQFAFFIMGDRYMCHSLRVLALLGILYFGFVLKIIMVQGS